MADVAALMHANLFDVFGERDAARRRAAIDRTYAPDVVFADPEVVVTGRDALDAKAGALLAASPDFVFTPAGPVMVNHDLGYLAWNLGPAGQPSVVRGLDIALGRVVDRLIAKLWTFLLTD